MIVINPCKCNGLPYVAPFYAPADIYQEDKMYIVRCMLCGNVGALEYTDNNAILKWNIQNEFKKTSNYKEKRDIRSTKR